MKKIAIILMLTAIIACNKNANQETKNTKVIWAETVQSSVPLERDTLWNKTDWDAVYKYDKEKIFSSITSAVKSGKLKAYADYPNRPFTVKEFNNIFSSWDSTNEAEYPINSGTFVPAPLLKEIKADDIVLLKFNEKIEFDTLSYSLNKEVSYITFFSYKYNILGDILGVKKLFDVKLNETPVRAKLNP